MRPLAILRPEPGASATASAAERLGLPTIVMPLFAVEPIAWRVPATAGFDALLLTSANAVRAAGTRLERLRPLPAHCVGEATADEARKAGLEVETVGSSGIEALLGTIPAHLRLLHLCGTDRREVTDPRQEIEHVAVYRVAELPCPSNFGQIEGAVAAVHSPRAGARLSSLVPEESLERERISVAAISEAAAQTAGSGWERIEAASEPTDAALLALAVELCNNPG